MSLCFSCPHCKGVKFDPKDNGWKCCKCGHIMSDDDLAATIPDAHLSKIGQEVHCNIETAKGRKYFTQKIKETKGDMRYAH